MLVLFIPEFIYKELSFRNLRLEDITNLEKIKPFLSVEDLATLVKLNNPNTTFIYDNRKQSFFSKLDKSKVDIISYWKEQLKNDSEANDTITYIKQVLALKGSDPSFTNKCFSFANEEKTKREPLIKKDYTKDQLIKKYSDFLNRPIDLNKDKIKISATEKLTFIVIREHINLLDTEEQDDLTKSIVLRVLKAMKRLGKDEDIAKTDWFRYFLDLFVVEPYKDGI